MRLPGILKNLGSHPRRRSNRLGALRKIRHRLNIHLTKTLGKCLQNFLFGGLDKEILSRCLITGLQEITHTRMRTVTNIIIEEQNIIASGKLVIAFPIGIDFRTTIATATTLKHNNRMLEIFRSNNEILVKRLLAPLQPNILIGKKSPNTARKIAHNILEKNFRFPKSLAIIEAILIKRRQLIGNTVKRIANICNSLFRVFKRLTAKGNFEITNLKEDINRQRHNGTLRRSQIDTRHGVLGNGIRHITLNRMNIGTIGGIRTILNHPPISAFHSVLNRFDTIVGIASNGRSRIEAIQRTHCPFGKGAEITILNRHLNSESIMGIRIHRLAHHRDRRDSLLVVEARIDSKFAIPSRFNREGINVSERRLGTKTETPGNGIGIRLSGFEIRGIHLGNGIVIQTNTIIRNGEPRLKPIRKMNFERRLGIASFNMRVIRITRKLANNGKNTVRIKSLGKGAESLW